ncbi:MAG TPA: TIR domain-containing protein [Lacunisphaera sp.]|nr:TIR domain-containing protein [Lacunisphaera sp.]
MSEGSKAVFLSYASQDAEAAKRICEALRAAGIEVWFDQNELVGGDAWDAKIRGQIGSCGLFLPIISANTQARLEGYFRLEWKLAGQRTHTMADEKAFLLPVVIDDTKDAVAKVPGEFKVVQWTKLPGGETPPAFVARVKKLLDGDSTEAGRPRPAVERGGGTPPPAGTGPSKWWWALPMFGVVMALALVLKEKRATPPPASSLPPPSPAVPAAPQTETQKLNAQERASVAVLAFANLSDDKANEYFSDGISEELLNVLAKVPGLKVSARTSAFYFKGKEMPVGEIARQLGVAYVIDGSVRKAGEKVRITAQLIKAADGFQVWSDTFTRDLKDIFAVQDEIAGLIAQQLQLTLARTARATAPINPEAFELYVKARRAWNLRSAAGFAEAEERLTRALILEPDFARAHAALADVWMLRAIANGVIDTFGQRTAPVFAQITSEIQKALALDPDSSEARASWGLVVRLRQWDLAGAEREFRRAIELNPNYATAHHWLGNCLSESGRIDEGLAEDRRAAELDPFSLRILENYAKGLVRAGRCEEALAVLGRAEALSAKAPLTLLTKAEALLQLGRRAEAIATARELDGTDRAELLARAGEKAEAESALPDAEGWLRYQLQTALGHTADAIANLRAEDVPSTELAGWLLDPRLDPFRSDPHFVELLKTLGLTEAHARMQAWRKAQAKR